MITLKNVRNCILDNGGTLIQHKDAYFTYFIDGGFGYAGIDRLSGLIHLSSVYKPSRENGTGARYYEGHNPNIDKIRAACFHVIGGAKVEFYKNLQDFLSSFYFVFESKVITKEKTVNAINLLDGYYVFVSNKHAPTIEKNHLQLHGRLFDGRNDEFKAIFLIEEGKIEAVNHNINLFENGSEMKKLEQRIIKDL